LDEVVIKPSRVNKNLLFFALLQEGNVRWEQILVFQETPSF